MIIYPLAARPPGVSHVIAIKQLYASRRRAPCHYFQTTLELRFLNRPAFYLLSIMRSRMRARAAQGITAPF